MGERVQPERDRMEVLKAIAQEGIQNAAKGFSSMVGRTIAVSDPVAHLVPLLSIPKYVSGPEDDTVGIYLRFDGDLLGQIIMIVPLQNALELVDLMMDVPAGTTQVLGSLEKSALGELGNMCGSFFLNAMAKIVKASFRPSPPAIMVDMVGAILDIVVATSLDAGEDVLLMKAKFADGPRSVEADFWVIPDIHALQALMQKSSES